MKKTIIFVVVIAIVGLVFWNLGGLIDKLLPAPAENGKNIVELISSIGWLIVVLVALLALFQPLGTFLEGISSRITKLSVFDVSIEVAQLTEFKPTWTTAAGDFRKITPDYVFDSFSQTLFQEIAKTAPAHYLIVDLGDGEQWLTSRLYLFAIMLKRMRKLKAFVFLAPVNNQPKCYVGTATTSQVRWKLARQFPWLEKSFADKYAENISQYFYSQTFPAQYNEALNQHFRSQNFLEQGKMDEQDAQNIARSFLGGIQTNVLPVIPHDQWTELNNPPPQPSLWENAKWLDLSLLKEILGSALYTGSVNYSPLDAPQEQARKIAAIDEPLIALTKANGIFHSLVDRQALLESIALGTLSSLADRQVKAP